MFECKGKSLYHITSFKYKGSVIFKSMEHFESYTVVKLDKQTFNFIFRYMIQIPWWLEGKIFACNVGNLSSIPWVGQIPKKKMATHSSVFLPENPVDEGGAWWAIVLRVSKSWT